MFAFLSYFNTHTLTSQRWIVNFSTFGYINAFGVYQDYYTLHYITNKSPSDISWIGSFQLFMMYAPGLFVGRAFDAGYL